MSGRPSSQLSVIKAVDHPCPEALKKPPGEAKPPIKVGTVGVGCGDAVGLGVGVSVGLGVGGAGVGGGGGAGVRAGAAVGAGVGSAATTSVGDRVGLGDALGDALGAAAWLDGGGVTSNPAVNPKRGSSAKSDSLGAPLAVGRGETGSTTTRVGERSSRASLPRPLARKAPLAAISTARLDPNFVPAGPPALSV